ncbi:hypothetical protein [Spirosoma panaciterrae]|uniref:hypothetical protein n=1 Tax=Spirosoma panaciterrae TaxID=496058 RepID=UPI00039B27F5|nr:hypothetical protein [Spirosoma panaciterrae]
MEIFLHTFFKQLKNNRIIAYQRQNYTTLLVIILMMLVIDGCKKNEVDISTELTTPDAISKVLIIPDAERIEGSPPPAQTTNGHITLTNETPEISGISGEDMVVSFRYKYNTANVTSPIKYLILYLEGASSYFKIPIKTVGQSGLLQVPIKIPSNYTIPPDNDIVKKCGIKLGRCTINGANSCYPDPTCIKGIGIPPRPGKGNSTIDGRTYDATAICDFEVPGFGRGTIIKMDATKMIILYNLGQGSFQLNNYENIADPFDSKTPYALYFDSATNIYYSTSGYVTTKGKVVSVNMVVKNFDGYFKQISAVGNCQ